MANAKNTKAKTDTGSFDGETGDAGSGGAVSTPMVMFFANTRVSGPDYVIEAGEAGPIPTKYAEGHVNDGHGVIEGDEIKIEGANND